MQAVLAWESNARQEAVILREVVAISDGEEEGDAASRKRKRVDAGPQRCSRGRGRGPRGGRVTRGRKPTGKGTSENAATNDEVSMICLINSYAMSVSDHVSVLLQSVLSKERLYEVLSVALSNAQ